PPLLIHRAVAPQSLLVPAWPISSARLHPPPSHTRSTSTCAVIVSLHLSPPPFPPPACRIPICSTPHSPRSRHAFLLLNAREILDCANAAGFVAPCIYSRSPCFPFSIPYAPLLRPRCHSFLLFLLFLFQKPNAAPTHHPSPHRPLAHSTHLLFKAPASFLSHPPRASKYLLTSPCAARISSIHTASGPSL
ncbi:hypothetical protein C8R44DRAFT_976480, partial [Mycena epipterygia]